MINAPGDLPLLEFDPARTAMLEPSSVQPSLDTPSAAVACYFPEVIEEFTKQGRPIMDLPSREPLWEIDYEGRRLGLFYPGVGAPLATNSLERVIAAGCRTIIACGGAGAMQPEMAMGHHVIVVTSAVRDEGTSYHYLPAGREISADETVAEVLKGVVERRGVPVLSGKSWTTDGLFRETSARVSRRREEGCLTVEMEAAALLAVSAFRGVRFGQLLYAGDDLSGEVWYDRDWRGASAVRRLLLTLAAEAALNLSEAS